MAPNDYGSSFMYVPSQPPTMYAKYPSKFTEDLSFSPSSDRMVPGVGKRVLSLLPRHPRSPIVHNFIHLQQQQQILLTIGKYLITLLSHPQIAYKLIEAGGAEDILQNKIYI